MKIFWRRSWKSCAEGGKIAARYRQVSPAIAQEDPRSCAKRRGVGNRSVQEERTIEGDAGSVLRLVYDALKKTGRILDENERESYVTPVFPAWWRGLLREKPAVVHAEIVGAEEGRVLCASRESAKEV
jgi:hypothetical protein